MAGYLGLGTPWQRMPWPQLLGSSTSAVPPWLGALPHGQASWHCLPATTPRAGSKHSLGSARTTKPT
eukprot:3124404-Lingulodinium_polyedra.AAC.1